MVKKFFESVIAIECDGGCLAEFRPELDDDETIVELVEVWGQAESTGWRRLSTLEGDLHFCPACVEKSNEFQTA